MNVRHSLQSGRKMLRLPGIGGGNGRPGGGLAGWIGAGLLPGTDSDYRLKAGNLWDNGIVATATLWMLTNFHAAKSVVYRPNAQGKEEAVPDHPALEILKHRPFPNYDPTFLWSGVLLSLNVDGNAYLYKMRGANGQVVGLFYIPHIQIEPRWAKTGRDYVSYYEYRVDGQLQPPIPVEDLLHIKFGFQDPLNIRKAVAPMKSSLRQIVTDNEIATYHAALMKNMGIPGVAMSPKAGVTGVTPAQIEQHKALFQRKFTGEHRGEPFGSTMPIDVQFISFSPEQLALDKMARLPTDRICAAMNVDPMVLGLPSESRTFSNYGEARQAAYEDCLIPRMAWIDEQLTYGLMPEIIGSQDGDTFGRDLTNVRILQPDYDALYKRLFMAVGGPFLTPNEARQQLHFDDRPGWDEPYPPRSAAPPDDPNAEPKGPAS